MNGKEALSILAEATEPRAAGKITRDGYVAIANAISVLASIVQAEEAKQVMDEERPNPQEPQQ